MFEGDWLRIRLDPELANRQIASLTASVEFASRPAVLSERVGTPRRDKIIEVSAPPDGWRTERVGVDVGAAVSSLFQLMQLIQATPEVSISGDIGAGSINVPWIRPILQRQFLCEVESALRCTRRGYNEVRERLCGIKGRPLGRSLGVAIQCGAGNIECDTEEFEFNTPLLRVIATTLDVIGRSRSVGIPAFTNLEQSNVACAVGLRRILAGVDSSTATVAWQSASRMKLGRFDRAWEQAINLAQPLLLGDATMASSTDADLKIATSPFPTTACGTCLLEVDTWKIWQALVERAAANYLKRDFGCCTQPWRGLSGSPKPDVQVIGSRDGDDARVVIDAKYKSYADGKVDAADKYQMFAYSYLTELPLPKELLLAHVGSTSDITLASQSRTKHYRMPDGGPPSHSPRLHLLPLPWPARNQLESNAEFCSGFNAVFSRALSAITRIAPQS